MRVPRIIIEEGEIPEMIPEVPPGGAPRGRACFTIALQTARDLTIRAERVITDDVDLVGAIIRAVLSDLCRLPLV